VKNQALQNTKHKIRITQAKAFSLVEATTALMILAFISASVLVVINRCVTSAADSALRMQAFEVARENMEKLLTADSVNQTIEFGTSDKYPEIQWQTVVECFYEPITERVWVKGVCSAEYTDSAGETKTVELTHWLTDVTKQQLLDLLNQLGEENALLAGQVIETIEEAAEYAGVSAETIEQWVENGMPITEDGFFAKLYLDLYKEHNGNPPPNAIAQLPPIEQLTAPPEDQTKPSEPDSSEPEPDGPKPPVKPESEPKENPFGLPDGYQEWPIGDIMGWLREHGFL